jgi:NitT/TauT family transport system substrate-binding protein
VRQAFLFVAALLVAAWATVGAAQSPTIVVRVAALQIGTVNWELDTIKRNRFDAANGFQLDVMHFADNGATRVAFEGGEADAAVVDWIWVARQRAAGKDYVFIPYSRAVGGLVVPQDSPAQSLADMAGLKIGIAGGPLDKSWLILRAYAQQAYGMDLERETEQVYGAPPLIYKTAVSGETDGAINFWHFLARMKADGMRELVSVADASVALGLDPDVPLLGYVMKESFLAQNPGIERAFYAATRQAKALLAEDDTAWMSLRDRMSASSDTEFRVLRDDFRAGIPTDSPVNAVSADKLLRLMAALGGARLVGGAMTLPPGVFIETR